MKNIVNSILTRLDDIVIGILIVGFLISVAGLGYALHMQGNSQAVAQPSYVIKIEYSPARGCQ